MNRIRKSFALLLCVCFLLVFASCSTEQKTSEDVPTWGDLKYKGTLPLQYADQFAIYQYEGGYSLIDMNNSERILVVPGKGFGFAGYVRLSCSVDEAIIARSADGFKRAMASFRR